MSHARLMQSQHVTPSLDTKPHQVSFRKIILAAQQMCCYFFQPRHYIFNLILAQDGS